MAVTNRKRVSSVTIPLIFISHDTRDADIAELFSELLRSVSAGMLKSFRSSDRKGSQGIEYGTEWYTELMNNLKSASQVVCLLTQRSFERPWILYEAGIAIGKLGTPVLGVALSIPLNRASTGPFAQFQNCSDDEDSLTKLVMQLVSHIPNADPNREVIKLQVQNFKQKISPILTALDKDQAKNTVDDTSAAKLFEEIKVMIQDSFSRVENKLEPRRKSSPGRRFHPLMLSQMMHLSDKVDAPLGLLMVFSLFRDEIPWLYEIGLDIYRTVKKGDPKELEKAITNFQMAVEFARSAPLLMEEMKDDEVYYITREVPAILERFLLEKVKELPKTSRKVDK